MCVPLSGNLFRFSELVVFFLGLCGFCPVAVSEATCLSVAETTAVIKSEGVHCLTCRPPTRGGRGGGALTFFFNHASTGYPRHRENRENGQKKSLSGKTQGIWKFCQNTGNFV